MSRRIAGLALGLVLAPGVPLAAATLCTTGNQLVDGGFEEATGDPAFSAAWTATSSSFLSPLCSIPYCGSGAGNAIPRGPGKWAWFGGGLSPETATLSQTVALPGGAHVVLEFWLLRGAGSGPATDTLTVRMDGAPLLTFLESFTRDAGYTLQSVPLDAFADGESHTLLFEYVGPSTHSGSFSVDDVSIDVTACLPTLFADGFESSDTSAWRWTVP